MNSRDGLYRYNLFIFSSLKIVFSCYPAGEADPVHPVLVFSGVLIVIKVIIVISVIPFFLYPVTEL